MDDSVDSDTLLSRIEDASLNASAPPQQRWLDGWIVRFNPGKAKRARCVNAVAAGRLPLHHKLALARQVYEAAGLPMVVRITRFTQPDTLDAQLADLGWVRLDDTRVMVCTALPSGDAPPLPAGTHWRRLDAATYAQAVGALRGSPPGHCAAHADRLASSPVPYQGYAIARDADQAVLACGQFAAEAEIVGLYDVFTHPDHRGQGLATLLCKRLLSISASQGATVAYLQAEADNAAARHIYRGLGFSDRYAYHYRQAP
jgi:GNAT superfamily N-acetyltransferase